MKKDFEKYLKSVVQEYIPILLLERYTFDYKKGTSNPHALMECKFNYPYLNATILYNDDVINRWKNGQNVKPIIIYELCHIITDPFYAKAMGRFSGADEIEAERELLTDYICNIVVKNNL